VLQTDTATPLELVKLKEPARLAWSVAGTSSEGFLTSGQPATATVYGGALAAAGGSPCASFSLLAPAGAAGPWHGQWPFTVSAGGPRAGALLRGHLVSGETLPLTVPLRTYHEAGSPLASLQIAVTGSVAYVNGLVVSAKLVGLHVAACPARARRAAA
jgi:hypothetical protein